MTSGSSAFQRAPRYSGARRATVVAAVAVALSGTALALPVATFAGTADANAVPVTAADLRSVAAAAQAAAAAESGPAAVVKLAGQEVEVPDLGVALPAVDVSTDVLGETVGVETAPDAQSDSDSDAGTDTEALDRAGSDDTERTGFRASPPTAVAPTRTPVALNSRVTDNSTGTLVAVEDDAAAAPEVTDSVRAAATLASEKQAPVERDGLGTPAPFARDGSSSGSTDSEQLLDLAAGPSAPAAASGDWDLMPEVAYAAIPLALAAALVVGHGRRSSRLAAAAAAPAAAATPSRRKHASG